MVGALVFNSTDKVIGTIVSWTSGTTVVLDITINDTWDTDTVYIMKDHFFQEGPVTALAGYGEGYVSFDENNMYVWDPFSAISNKLNGIGCVNHSTLKAINGNLIWVNRSGIYLWNGQGRPIEISGYLKDTQDGYGIWDLLTTANFATMSAGVDESNGLYYLSIGDLQTLAGAPCSAITNAVLVFDIAKGEWELHSYNREPYHFVNFINKDGAKNLYFGEKDAAAVYQLNTGTTDAVGDGTTATIPFELRTKSHVLGNPTFARRIRSYFIRYISTNSATLSTSVNEGSFVEQDTLEASSVVKTLEIKPSKAMEGVLHSIKIVGTGRFVLKGYGFSYDELTTNRLPNS